MDVTSSVSTKRFAVVAADGASYADLREHIAYNMANAIELDCELGSCFIRRRSKVLESGNAAQTEHQLVTNCAQLHEIVAGDGECNG